LVNNLDFLGFSREFFLNVDKKRQDKSCLLDLIE
jgi:hypothetical protein